MKCRISHPTRRDKLRILLNIPVELHAWEPYTRQVRHINYYCRKCDCGAEEIQNAGPMGDGSWRDINIPFKDKWEQDSFDSSVIL